MRRAYQVTALIFLAFSLWVVFEASRLKYFTQLGPGPGFFPFWLGLILAGLSVGLFVKVTFGPVAEMAAGFIPGRTGVLRMIAIIVALALAGLLVDVVGFRVMMFSFLLFLLLALGRQNLLLTLALCFIGSFGLSYVFSNYLGVFLPSSSIEFLANLGL